jgi:RNA polymerase sigma-70 factor, ECF subfamily
VTQVLAELLPEEPEAKGLLALMLFHRARQAARVNARGDLVTLEDQDRTRWDQAGISLARQPTPGAVLSPGCCCDMAPSPGRAC